ncbi:uncharacterized protein LOC126852461 [Cataglyphis hispanica]|uniref:uncharacterized protein LOC126852461 n=1 Tax=Cataglyphis hispanica TaxID=1086592 RepID=UPI0021800730|nr:uncharacterized protein LOC126852461 [Cataglyphis hispanica]
MAGSKSIREREKIARKIAKTSESIRKKHRALKTGKIEEAIFDRGKERSNIDAEIEPLIIQKREKDATLKKREKQSDVWSNHSATPHKSKRLDAPLDEPPITTTPSATMEIVPTMPELLAREDVFQTTDDSLITFLIIKRTPDEIIYTDDDKQTYKSMLLATSAHKDNHDAHGQIRGNRGYKYKEIIAPLMSIKPKKKKSGKGASVIERFNHTLKDAMWKMFTLNGSYKWIDELPRLVSDYNARKHRMIIRPIDVTPAITERLLATVYSAIKIAGLVKFKIGDSVRVSKYKTIFEEGYAPNWTTEVFKIFKVQRTNPVTYLFEDYRGKSIAGAFYEYELRRANYPDVYLVEKVLRRRVTRFT